MLTSPWIVFEYKHGPNLVQRGVIVYYRRSGETEEEFMYLLDFLRHFQVMEDASKVEVRSIATDAAATARFQKAKQRYIESLGDNGHSTELAGKVNAIGYSKLTQVVTKFSSVNLGMDYA
jgi:hypothetical protein